MYLFEGTDEHILNWQQQMKAGRPNLKEFLLHMEKKGLIVKYGKKYKIIKCDVVSDGYFPTKLRNWLDSISGKLCVFNNAVDTERYVKQRINERKMS